MVKTKRELGDMKINHKIKKRLLAEFNQFKVFNFQNPVKPQCMCLSKHELIASQIKKDIVVIYSKGTVDLASVQMRLLQVAKYILFLNTEIKILALSSRSSNILSLKNSIIILSKFAVESISSTELTTLVKNNNSIFIDPVDSKLEISKFHGDCTFIASSFEQNNYLKTLTKTPVELIYHSSDLRLKSLRAQNDTFAIGYFGNLSRILPDYKKLDKLSIIKTPLSYELRRVLPRYAPDLIKYSAHLATGTVPPKYIFKPFTKGIVASHVGALSLISQNDQEGVSLLGQNYPYVAHSNSTKSVSEMIDYMQKSYMSKEWKLAHELSRNLEPYYCEVNITNMWQQLLA
jgi:hypothetical protein